MARRRGIVSTINRIAREAAKAQRAAERNKIAKQRDRERQERQQRQYVRQLEQERQRDIKLAIKEQKAYEKEQKILYLESRKNEVADLNADVQYILEEFRNVLSHTLAIDDVISFETLYRKDKFPKFAPPELKPITQPVAPTKEEFFRGINKNPSIIEKLVGVGKKQRLHAIEEAERKYNAALGSYENQIVIAENTKKENERLVHEAREQHDLEKKKFEHELLMYNQEIDRFKSNYFSGEQESVEAYNAMVLERSEYNDIFPQEFDLFYVPDSKELVVQYELPSIQAIPENKEYKYVQKNDEIRGTEFKVKEKNEIYSYLLASITLRTLHELFEADQANVLSSVVFNGFVSTIDPRTGLDVRPCVITVQTKKEEFMKFDLSKVDVIECVKGLRAQISPSLSDLAPVKPIVNFDMLDRRFVDERDMLSTLDERTNLLEMDPFDFEHLICNLFSKIGLESKLTRSSRDGGVDVVAFDPRPVFGGKYVIQAKRYRNTVEVAAVRDLYGTMMNENASKGILVTTSSFGADARSFAKDKPIELIDGNNLLYLLEEHGIQAKIVIPSK